MKADKRIGVAIKVLTVLFAVMLVCCGCASEQGQIFEDSELGIFWPSPPDRPRVQYLGELTGEEDLKREVFFTEALGDLIFGRKDVGIFLGPHSMAVDDADGLFVADRSGGVVHMMNLRTRSYGQFSRLDGEKRLVSPVGVVAVDDDIYVSDSVLKKICVFSRQGVYKCSFGSEILHRPSGIAYSESEQKLYVADTVRHVIVVFDKEGNLLKEIGSRGMGKGQFNFPTHLWVDERGMLYVSDTLNYRVQVFGPDGEFSMAFGKHGNRAGCFAHPCGIATDSFGNIYVGDKQFENIQIFDSSGKILMALGGEGRGPGEFWLPGGIFIDGENRIYAADSFNRRVQVFQLLSLIDDQME